MNWSLGRAASAILAVSVALCALPMPAQELASVVLQQAPIPESRGEQAPTIKTDVRLVTLDVIVTDESGRTVQGLEASDFRLLEDGTAQQLANFDEHTRPLHPEVREKLPANTFRDYGPGEESSSIVLVLDVLDSPDVKEQMYLRNQMLAYMKSVPEGTRFAIMQLDTRLHLIQGFTSDPEELLQAVMTKRDSPKFSPTHSPCSEDVHPMSILGLPPITSVAGLPDPCYPDPNSKSAAQLAELGDPYGANNAALRKGILGQAVPQLTNYLSGFPGRKSVVWFYSQAAPNEAFSMGVKATFADKTSFVEQLGRTTHVLTLNQIALTLVNTTMEWGVSPENAAMRASLRAQGGDFVTNTNGLKQVIERVADSAWNYYTLSYSPTDRNFDGKFRKLEVQLERRGLYLQYRHGYYAVNDDAKRAQHSVDLRGGPPSAGVDGNSIKMAMQMGVQTPPDVRFIAHVEPAVEVQKKSGKTPLTQTNFLEKKYRLENTREYRIAYKVDTDSLKLTPEANGSRRGRVDFVCVVYDDEGNVVNSIVSRASVSADARTYADLMKDGVETTQTVVVPAKGNFFLRIGVHDVSADKVGALEVPVSEIKLGVPVAGTQAKW